ncbi:low-specificity L-threonine aldolase [Flavisolibacter tropicus]|uniref:Threonine aldolase n=1 Tax=Flavisolibacter tropicus TaxID=1492898 RepID=A0A172TR06_9BACT|nr:low-specificity L-threonine aldolase [Flavisolibacter tropicus]ANE49460.1 threonine aldolase [Flavisolibacter tropicus]
MIIDYRSDTVTRPTAGMLEAMMRAKVGDDVLGDDPSVNELEALSADLFGMEAALFCPSGTMTNQIAIKCHTQPGDEVICDFTSHVYQYEGGGIAFNSSASVQLLQGNRGRITADQVRNSINADDVHKPHTSLVSLENTCNRGGGSCYELEEIQKIRTVCDERGLKLHLDGARLYNAIVAKKQSAQEFGQLFHTISVCLSKGLGCPVGSVLLGPADFIKKARRIRKVFGGGMRQAGFIAAAGIYALRNHVDRLEEDHQHAKQLEAALNELPFVSQVLPVETNIVIFTVAEGYTPQNLVAQLKEKGILAYAISATQIRLVTHLDVTPDMINETIRIFQQL